MPIGAAKRVRTPTSRLLPFLELRRTEGVTKPARIVSKVVLGGGLALSNPETDLHELRSTVRNRQRRKGQTLSRAAAILLLLFVLIGLVATPQIAAQAQLPDLVVTIQPVPSTARVGDMLQVDETVVNQGTGPAGAFRLGLYFSTNTTISTADVFFGFCNVPGLAPGGSFRCSGPLPIPSLAPGVYFVGVIADDQGAITESNKSNNTAVTGPIIVTRPGTFVLTVDVLGTGSGTVTSDQGGINCKTGNVGICFAGFPSGTRVTLTATPSGSMFTGWSVATCSVQFTCTVTMNDNMAVKANFTPFVPSLTALNTNQTIYRPGDPFVLTLLLGTRPNEPIHGDLYVQMTLPDKSTLFLDKTAQFTSAARPFRADFTIARPSETEIFSQSGFPFDKPGTYTLEAFHVKTGSSDPRNRDNHVGSGLPIQVALLTPSSVGGTSTTILTKSEAFFIDIDVNPATHTAIVGRVPNIVSTVNLVTNKIVSSIPIPLSSNFFLAIGQIVVNQKTEVAAVEFLTSPPPSASSCSVALVDLRTATFSGSIPLPQGVGCFFDFESSLAVDPESNRAVALSRNPGPPDQEFINVIDLTAKKVVSGFPVSEFITSFTLIPGTNTLIAAVFPSFDIVFIDLSSGLITKRFPKAVDANASFNFIALLPQSNRLVIAAATGQSTSVAVLDLTTGQRTASVPLPGIPMALGLAVNPITNQAAVVGPLTTVVFSNILGAFAVPPARLFLIDLDTHNVTPFDLPTVPFSVAIDPNTNTILVPAGEGGPALFLIQPQALPVPPQFAPLQVTVRASDTGAPIAGATVAVKQTGLATVTSNFGEADFPAAPVGSQIVTVSASGFGPKEVRVDVLAGVANVVTISLARQALFGTLTGVVVGGVSPGATMSPAAVRRAPGQAAAQGARWHYPGKAAGVPHAAPSPPCTPQNGTPIPVAVTLKSSGITVTTQADGTFILQAPAGSVLVGIQAPGQHSNEIIEQILQNEVTCVVVTLLPTLTTVGGVMPSFGPDTGGTAVSIAGTNFLSGVTVTLGGIPATSVAVVSSTTLTAITPAHAAGAVDVTITNPDGQTATLPKESGYTYIHQGPAPTRLTNLSTRGLVQTGDNVMIGGFIIGGTTPKTVLVRAVGPSLTAFGVPGALANPVLRLVAGQTPIAENNDWQVALPLCQQSGHTCGGPAEITAAGLAPSHPLEAAIHITLAPGAYTAIVSGFGGTTGVGLVEVFEVP